MHLNSTYRCLREGEVVDADGYPTQLAAVLGGLGFRVSGLGV